jgi:hypothetical protein
MTYKLFLDDYRHPKFLAENKYPYNPKGAWVIARSCAEAINIVEAMGVPLFVAFDHDLEDAHYDGKEGHERTGLSFAEWLTDYFDNNNVELDDEFDWCIHSMNPSGADRIRQHMARWYKRYYERRYG